MVAMKRTDPSPPSSFLPLSPSPPRRSGHRRSHIHTRDNNDDLRLRCRRLGWPLRTVGMLVMLLVPLILFQWSLIRRVHRDSDRMLHHYLLSSPNEVPILPFHAGDTTTRAPPWLNDGNDPIPPPRLPSRSVNATSESRFPVWQDPAGIHLQYQVVEFAQLALHGFASTLKWGKSRAQFSEILYVMDQRGVWVSSTLRNRTMKYQHMYRLQPSEGILRYAYHLLLTGKPPPPPPPPKVPSSSSLTRVGNPLSPPWHSLAALSSPQQKQKPSKISPATTHDDDDGDSSSTTHRRLRESTTTTMSMASRQQRWPSLTRAIRHGVGVPFLVWYGDYKSCPRDSWYSTLHLGAKGLPIEEYLQSPAYLSRQTIPGAASTNTSTVTFSSSTGRSTVSSRRLSSAPLWQESNGTHILAGGTNGTVLPLVGDENLRAAATRRWTHPAHPSSFRIPLLTTCARVDCQHALPLPTYKTIRDSRAQPADWDAVFASYATLHPWASKIPQLVWRGTLSGEHEGGAEENPRWNLGKVVTQHNATGLFDVGLVGIPARHDHLKLELSQVGGLKPPLRPMESFMRYQAILDIDGNSWSSRFGTLLCYNSVVLKVEPHYVDYFHFRDLQPNVHYIPVKYDLSDLVAQTAWTLDPANTAEVQAIVHNANEWCQHRMIWSSIAQDYLDILEQYVTYLDRADPTWATRDKDQYPDRSGLGGLVKSTVLSYLGMDQHRSDVEANTTEPWSWAKAKAEIFTRRPKSKTKRKNKSALDVEEVVVPEFRMVKITQDLRREDFEASADSKDDKESTKVKKKAKTKVLKRTKFLSRF